MSVTSKERRGRLEDAAQASVFLTVPTSLRLKLRASEQAARAAISGGAVKLTIANGQRVEFFDAGAGQITQTELVELYRDLVDSFDTAFVFLTKCALYGLDAFLTEFSLFPSGLAAVNPHVIVDTSGRWLDLCTQFSVTSNQVIGATVNDKSVFLWLMFHEVPCYTASSDYGQMRVSEGAQFT